MTDQSVMSCLGHLWHPFGAALLIVGTMKELHLETGRTGKGGVAVAKFTQRVLFVLSILVPVAHKRVLWNFWK